MTSVQRQRVNALQAWQIKLVKSVCQKVLDREKQSVTNKDAFLAFWRVFVLACLICDEDFILYLRRLYLFAVGRATNNGDAEAESIVSGLNDALQVLLDTPTPQ